jgi:putative acyl-CoA dehydrogenase
VRQTHTVFNQVPLLLGWSLADHPVLAESLQRENARSALAKIQSLGELAGSAEAQQWGDLAEAHPPQLKTHDRFGNRIDEVVYDPSYHQVMRTTVEHGVHAAAWAAPRPFAHLARAAKMVVWGRPAQGTYAPSP